MIWFPAMDSVIVLMTGMPPATAASKRMTRPRLSASCARC
ncbi:secreted protein [marine sediment metagenome]|uniref:Secreted protein n=1 Tax=marine sediment metagenome TaxID=412755 RepID=A0A1B6NUS6_9ZZZZ